MIYYQQISDFQISSYTIYPQSHKKNLKEKGSQKKLKKPCYIPPYML